MKTIVFLGAGASKADGAPLQNELFTKYFEMRFKNRKSGLMSSDDITDKMEQRIARLFDDLFGIKDPYNPGIKFPTFEEVLGMIDLAEMRNERFFRPERTSTYNFPVITETQADRLPVILSMAEIIHYKLDVDNEVGGVKYHNMLIENMQKRDLLKDTLFISTNYDLLIDNALLRNGFDTIDYGFKQFNKRLSGNEIALYKIHGSLNWLYCPICNIVDVKNGEKAVFELIRNSDQCRCWKCNNLRQSLIVPPTYFKDMSNYYLSSIWTNADVAMKDVEHIVFCGYSFPDADIHIKYLLKRAEIGADPNKKFHVTIINGCKHPDDPSRIFEENQYKRFFKATTIIDYKSMMFQEFAENPLSVII